MPNLMKTIKETMIKQNYPPEVIDLLGFDAEPAGEGSAKGASTAIFGVIERMDKLLTHEQCLAIMEQQGCCVTGKPAAAHRAFGQKYSDKSVAERIALLGELDSVHNPPCRLIDDGTLSVFWGMEDNGAYRCVCGYVNKLPQPAHISSTFCGCCGGHARKNLERSLGVKLRLKEIISSAASTDGKKQCEFLYEIN
jgi:hypothetical protein